MENDYFFLDSPLAKFISWTYAIISIFLVFYPFIYLGYRKWKKRLPISWSLIFGVYVASLFIYLCWNWGLWMVADILLQKYYVNSWWLTNALLEGGGGPFFALLIGWPLSIFYILMAIKPGRYIISNLLLSIIVSSSLLVGVWYFLTFFMKLGLYAIGLNIL